MVQFETYCYMCVYIKETIENLLDCELVIRNFCVFFKWNTGYQISWWRKISHEIYIEIKSRGTAIAMQNGLYTILFCLSEFRT